MKPPAFALALSVLWAAQAAHAAAVMQWADWSFLPVALQAQASLPGGGNVQLQASGTGTSVGGMAIAFSEASLGNAAPSVAVGHGPALSSWSFTLDLDAAAAAAGLVLGVGNLGHGAATLPGFALAAWDAAGAVVDLSTLLQLGSFDHQWPHLATPLLFNDDVALVGSQFVVTDTPGGSQTDSDILLLKLPAHVRRLTIATQGETVGDTVNVLVGQAVPEPGTHLLTAVALAVWVARVGRRGRRPGR